MRESARVKSRKVWRVREADPEAAQALGAQLGVPEFIAQILINRGVDGADSARQFLNPQLSHLSDPCDLGNIAEAAARIDEAVRNREQIVIYGDYDVDGTAAVALLYRLLRMAGANVGYYVPSRLEEGYGLNLEAMQKIREGGANLVITVDCGITALAEADFLAEAGIDLVVTDHHEPVLERPRAVAIVDPKADPAEGAFRELSGVGVAFKLAWAVAQQFSRSERVAPQFRELLVESLALVALGTVADVVPLVGENRALVAFGLKQLVQSRLPGLRALIEACGTGDRVTSERIAFALAPRLNAAGRMGDAKEAIELFISEDFTSARRLAASLEKHNSTRQRKERAIFEQARSMIEADPSLVSDHAIVLCEESWHTGVIGIVASRLVEEFYRPAVVITMEGDIGQGSARSIPPLNLFETLSAVQNTLVSFGGHSQAAGLRVARSDLDAFREAFFAEVRARLSPQDLEPVLNVDAVVKLGDITLDAVDNVERLRPFGHGNPAPRLAAHGVEIAGVAKRVGSAGKHLVMTVRQDRCAIRAVAFGRGELLADIERAKCLDIAFVPFINSYMKDRSAELRVEDLTVY